MARRRVKPLTKDALVSGTARARVSRTTLLALALVLTFTPASASTLSPEASVRDSARTATCTNRALRVFTWSDFATYAAHSPVHITTFVRNVGRTTCNVALGATSPQVSVTSTTHGVIWRSCARTPCPMFLVLVQLKAGASVARETTWNQHANDQLAPRGFYRVRSRLGATSSQVAATIHLATANAQRTSLIHVTDTRQRVTVEVGARIVLDVAQPGAYTWSRPSSSTTTLATQYARGGVTAIAFFRATRAGSATISITATPRCYPRCLAASRLYRVYVDVT